MNIDTRIVGVWVGDRQLHISQMNTGEKRIVIRPEPDNMYDKNALLVFNNGGRSLGYIPRDIALQLKGKIIEDLDGSVVSVSHEYDRRGKYRYQLDISFTVDA